MNAGVQVFLYPEELEHVGPDELAAQVLELGCDAVSVAVAYHRGRRVFPRHRRVSVLTRTTIYLEPDASALWHAPAGGNRDACAAPLPGGMRPGGTPLPRVGRRPAQDALAAAHPDAAARLLDGSPAGHSLCPSAPETVEYVAALAADVAAQLGPEAVDLEAAFYPAWEPSYTLTLALEPISDQARLLLPQCFCSSCRVLFGQDVEARAHAAEAGVVEELARGRAAGARRLVDAAAAAVHEQGSLLRVFASGLPEQAVVQGVSPESVAAADAVLDGCGPLRGDELIARFAGLRAVTGRPGSVSTNWTPERTALAADVERLAAAGADGLALYNLSLVPEAGLEAFVQRLTPSAAWWGPMVIDGHVMLGRGRDASLSVEQLLATMDRLGIDQALVSPAEGYLPVRNDEGNELTAAAAAASAGACLPTRSRRHGSAPTRSRSCGARVMPARGRSSSTPRCRASTCSTARRSRSIAFAIESGWPVYVRTGTPPHALPLQLAWLAARFPEANFLLGKAGATDFSHDGPATLEAASNVYADSVYVEWPTALAAADPTGARWPRLLLHGCPVRRSRDRAGPSHRGAVRRRGSRRDPRRHPGAAARAVIGLVPGDRVVVHSSLRAVGLDADELVDALLAAVGPRGLRRDADLHLRQRDVRSGHAESRRRSHRSVSPPAGCRSPGAPDLLGSGDRRRSGMSCSTGTSAWGRPASEARSTGSRQPGATFSCSASATRRTRPYTWASSTRTRRISTFRSTRPGRPTETTASRAAAARSACSSGRSANEGRSGTGRSAARSRSSSRAPR